MAAVDAVDCAIEGTVKEAKREVLAFDNTGAADVSSIAVDFVADLDSVGVGFDVMTMGCFNFNSSFVGFEAVSAILLALTVCAALAGFTILAFLFFTTAISVFLASFLTGVKTAFADLTFKGGLATVLATGFAAFFTSAFATGFAAAFLAGLAKGLDIVLVRGFLTTFAGALTGFLVTGLAAAWTAAFTTAFTTTLLGAFLAIFFATVFMRSYPAMPAFQSKFQTIKQFTKIQSARDCSR